MLVLAIGMRALGSESGAVVGVCVLAALLMPEELETERECGAGGVKTRSCGFTQ